MPNATVSATVSALFPEHSVRLSMLSGSLGPAESGTAAAEAFYACVQRRADESRKSRRVLNEAPIEMYKLRARPEPDYAEIVKQINSCLAEIRPRWNWTEFVQLVTNTPISESETLLKKVEKMRPPVQ
jgi:hypothetical protein